tara:strand:- start:1884 stop:3233 length:1350 start_codon:yes stop_codon:yes gene_type:complete
MSIKEIKSGTLYKEYAVEIPYEEVNFIIDSKINEILPTVSLPGFRKGKAPVNIVRKKYEDNILSEAIEKLVQDKTKDILDKKNLKPFVQPRVELKKYEKNEPIEVEVKINLEPEIKLKDFKNFEIFNYEINLDKNLLEKNYKDFLNNQKKYSPIKNNREIMKSDKVLVNLSSDNDFVPKFLKSQKNLPVFIDSEFQIIPELSLKLMKKKLKKSDKIKLELDVSKALKFDKEKIAEFDVEIVDIEESKPFVVDKDFLEKSGLKNEDELKNNLEKNLKSQYENGLKQIEKKQLMDILDKEHNFDIPEGIVDQEFDEIWNRIENAKKDNTLDDDDKKLSDDQLKKRYEKISKRRVKLGILLQYIAKEKKISVEEKELTNGMMAYASQYPGQEKQIIEYFKKNPSSIETIRGPILEEKVINAVISSSKTVKKKINKEEYEDLEKITFDVKREK